jgi:hypothetical protein
MVIKLLYFGKITGYDMVNYLSPVAAFCCGFAQKDADGAI